MDAAAALARDQDGVVTRRQALAAGTTRSALAHRLRPGGPWQRLLPGVYATFTGTPTTVQRMRAALLFAGDGAVLTGRSALALLGMRGGSDDGPVHVLMPHARRRASTGFVVLHRSRRVPASWTRHGLPLAPPVRAVADRCRGVEELDEVRAVVAEAVQRARTTVERLLTEALAGPRRGRRALRVVLGEVGAGPRSVPEIHVRTLLRRSSLPPPAYNVDVYDGAGRWLARPDAWWEDVALAYETDSRAWHLSPADWEATMRRHDRLAAHGVTVLHVSPRRLAEEPDAVLAELAQAHRTAAGRTRPPVTCAPASRASPA